MELSGSVLKYGVPQGSVLGPILFPLYMLPLWHIIEYHSVFHCYADDTQLYLSVKLSGQGELSALLSCINDVKGLMSKISYSQMMKNLTSLSLALSTW